MIVNTKARAAEALARVVPDSDAGVSALIESLKTCKEGGEMIIEALARLGPRALAAVPALVAFARDTKRYDRFEAIQALMRIDGGHEAILPALTRRSSPTGRLRPDPARTRY